MIAISSFTVVLLSIILLQLSLLFLLIVIIVLFIVSKWLCNVRDAPLEKWNHPSLLHPQQSWKVLKHQLSDLIIVSNVNYCTTMHVYACMHVCMYACMHVCMYACMHV